MQLQSKLADRYLLTAHIARGGMADVFEAHDELLDRRVAVKVLHSQFSTDPAFVRRFRREAQAAANLSHPNIVAIYDWGESGSTYFIVMELIEGRSLRDVLRREGPLLPRRAGEIAAEVAAALAVAHRSGLIHRDIKPGNILLSPDGTVKVTDFGIARAWDDSQELTRTGAVIGTATYFSPEQAQGIVADERSDIYSLGVVLYEMLAGRPPFRGESPVAVAYQHVSAVADLPSTLNADVPPILDQIVMRTIDKDPNRRYQRTDDLRADLLRFIKGQEPATVPSSDAPTQLFPPSDVPPPTVPPDEAYRQMAPERRSGNSVPFIATVVALLAVLLLGVFLLIRLLGGDTGDTAVGDVVTIPDVANRTQEEALLALQQLGLIVRPVGEASDSVPEGVVIRTEPPAGQQVETGSTVTVVVSTGQESIPVPPLVNETLDEARRLIELQGFEVGAVTDEPSATVEEGRVVGQDPAPGSRAAPGSAIDLVVSSGPETVVLTDLAGRSEREVTSTLFDLGLEVEVVEEFSAEFAEGFVIRTDPGPGTEVASGDTVTVYVSRGAEPVQVPDLFGVSPDEAERILGDRGLALRVSSETVFTEPRLEGLIVDQTPASGTSVERGTIVVVRLGVLPATTTTAPPPTTTTTAPPPTTTSPPPDTSTPGIN